MCDSYLHFRDCLGPSLRSPKSILSQPDLFTMNSHKVKKQIRRVKANYRERNRMHGLVSYISSLNV